MYFFYKILPYVYIQNYYFCIMIKEKDRKDMKDIKLKIGELSRLCHVSVRTLYHYEEIGLLEPSIVSPDTGHRYYDSKQLLRLCYIIWLKEQGMTLSDIREMFAKGDSFSDLTKLERQLQKCNEELERLNKQRHCLKALINNHKKIENTSDIYLDKLPSIIVASHTMMLSNYINLEKHVMEVVGPEMLRIGCITPHPIYCFSQETGKVSENGKFEVEFCDEVLNLLEDSEIIQFKRLPEVPLAICMKVYGANDSLETNRLHLFAEIAQRGYQIVGSVRYNYVYGAWNQKNPQKWLTIIQVPVEKNTAD